MISSKLYSVFGILISLVSASYLLYLALISQEHGSEFYITAIISAIIILGDVTLRFRKAKDLK